MPPTPPTAPQAGAPSASAQTEEQMRSQLAEMERRNQTSRQEAEGILAEIENKEMREALGLDIEFDVSKLITQGIIEKRGVKAMEGLYVDMHTLTKEEDILAEQLVEQVYESLGGGIKMSKPYYEAKSSAILAMAITRFNNRVFPLILDKEKRGTEEFKKSWDGKVDLFNILLKFPSNLVDSLGFIYVNLDKADILVEGPKQKKSSRP